MAKFGFSQQVQQRLGRVAVHTPMVLRSEVTVE
jgi:hypothetical protein